MSVSIDVLQPQGTNTLFILFYYIFYNIVSNTITRHKSSMTDVQISRARIFQRAILHYVAQQHSSTPQIIKKIQAQSDQLNTCTLISH